MTEGSVVVTGGNRGIGLELATILARSGRRVMIACRRPDEGERAVAALGLDIAVARLDLSSHASIDRFVAEAPRDLAALVNNAGAMFSERRMTDDGVEQTLAVNCVGPLRLTEALVRDKPLRIVNVVTAALGNVDLDAPPSKHSAMRAYLNAKMAFMHVARAWAAAWKSREVVVHSLHPGMARTAMLEAPKVEGGGLFWKLMIPMLRPFAAPPERAARVLAMLVEDAAYASVTDVLWHGGKRAKWPAKLADAARNEAVAFAMQRLSGHAGG